MNTQNFTWTNELVLEFFFNADRQATAEKAIADFIASKQKKPVLTTHDDVELFEGDDSWYINDSSFMVAKNTVSSIDIMGIPFGKLFSTKETAEHYVMINKPHLSVQDVIDCYKKNYYSSDNNFIAAFSEKLTKHKK